MGGKEQDLAERRATLARAAQRLNARNAAQLHLPPLILMTDDERGGDYVHAAEALPRGSAVIVRWRDGAVRAELGRHLIDACRPRGVRVLIANDAALAERLRADGAHAPQSAIARIEGWRRAHPRWLITAAAHDPAAIAAAGRCGADAVLVSPVFATQSHFGAASLGIARFASLVQGAAIPAYALGGITYENAARLSALRVSGLALIGGWIRS